MWAGTMGIASDDRHLAENLEPLVLSAAMHDAAANLAVQDRMRLVASRPKVIIPDHDPKVFAMSAQVV